MSMVPSLQRGSLTLVPVYVRRRFTKVFKKKSLLFQLALSRKILTPNLTLIPSIRFFLV
jgi:hypothetical protein